MPGSILVARIFGIDVRLHFSWILIFALVFYSLWSEVFPSDYPFWSDQKLIIVSAITAFLFFVSILAHELSHSLVARRFKMRVSSITLFLLGGVANLRQEPPSAGAEFFMAGAGPFTSFVIGGIGLGIWALVEASSAASLQTVGAVARYIGTINLYLGAFNLIPGFPLDGGRVLRSIIWGIRKDRSLATRIAGRGGQLAAGGFVVWALVQLVSFGGAGLWWWPLLLAYFLYNAATQSMQQERVGGLVAGMRVGPLMSTSFHTAAPGASVASVVRDVMLPFNLRAVPILRGPELVGLATADGVRQVDHERWSTTPIDQVMTPSRDLQTLSPDDPLERALARFEESPVLPVLRDGALVGLLERDAVANYVRMRDLFAGRR